MWPDELNDLVIELSEKIRRHGDVFRSNETATRYSLIDPVLAALGWDLSDTSQVRPEFPLGGRNRVADYAMLHETGQPRFFVEAKNLDTAIDKDSPAVEQAINYTIRSDCEYVVITNGDTWEAYRPRASGELHERRTTAFRIMSEDQRSTVMAMLWLWRWRWEGAEPVDLPVVDVPDVSSAQGTPAPYFESSTPTPPPVSPPNSLRTSDIADPPPHPRTEVGPVRTGRPLNGMRNVSGEEPPQSMTFPGGATKTVGKWNRIQIATVEWLIETGRLTEAGCPLTGPKGAYLVDTTPYKQNGTLIRKGKQIGQFWIDLNFRAHNQVRRAIRILEAAGVDPATIYVS